MNPQLKVASVVPVKFAVSTHIIMQYTDLSQFPRPLFASRLAYSIRKKADLILHISCCTV
jgi:hypothetical protein